MLRTLDAGDDVGMEGDWPDRIAASEFPLMSQ
jgi:hypothetical protein